jgi:hypothetical protein
VCLVPYESSRGLVCVFYCTQAVTSDYFTFHEWINVIIKLCCSDKNGNIYTNSEMTDILFIHGLIDGNIKETCRLHQEWLPGHRIPGRSRYNRIHQHTRDIAASVLH